MRICILGSGSSGNATLVVAGETRVLIDCGLSARELAKRMREVGEDPSKLNAVVVTHEHGDHAGGLAPVAHAFDVPAYISTATLAACDLGERAAHIPRGHELRGGEHFEIGELRFNPFSISHDAVDPLAFTVESRGAKLGIAVDLGYFDNLAAEQFRGCDVLIIEANHEIEMLRACSAYPWALKQRILGRQGHTSNDEMARFLREDFDGQAEHIVLAHLSRNSNHPELARLAAVQALDARGPLFYRDFERRVRIARYDGPGDWIEV
jgi:phosphoribosyl 1,2-cyclic phosphodiesterase